MVDHWRAGWEGVDAIGESANVAMHLNDRPAVKADRGAPGATADSLPPRFRRGGKRPASDLSRGQRGLPAGIAALKSALMIVSSEA